MISYMKAYCFYELVIHRQWEKKTHQNVHCCEQWNKLAEGEDSTTAQTGPSKCSYLIATLLIL